VPNHKLIPDVRWILDRSSSGVLARSSYRTKATPNPAPPKRGVVILVVTRIALFKQALVTKTDNPLDNYPPAGFTRAATSPYYAAYVHC
jgi:hypothetical protein